MKKFFFLGMIFFYTSVYSEEFVYVCRDDSGFIMTFNINTLSKTITHKSSLTENSLDISNPSESTEVNNKI